jgi:two-component system sensor histidine kinase/response regulator
MIYSHLSISGIKNVDTLRGFQIGVQDGDACIDILKQRGVSEIRSYPNYELLINAALADDVKLFCMDEQPADFYLYRKNAQHDLHQGIRALSSARRTVR